MGITAEGAVDEGWDKDETVEGGGRPGKLVKRRMRKMRTFPYVVHRDASSTAEQSCLALP
jgi:hypothetical protein